VKIKNYLLSEIDKHGTIHMTLLDPDKLSLEEFVKLAKMAENYGSSALMVGGSLGVSSNLLDNYLREVKSELTIPIILFPGSVAGLSQYADAVWFLSVLNSTDPYFIIGAQTQAAIMIAKRFKNLEPISLAYIIIGDGGCVGYVSHARPIPYDKVEIMIAYALAAQYLGFDFIYLEAGSGAKEPIPPENVNKVRRVISKPLIIGGGIREPETAYKIAKAGADIIVTGTIVEKSPEVLKKIIEAVKSGGRDKIVNRKTTLITEV